MGIKVDRIKKSKILSIVGAGMSEYQGHNTIFPITRRGISNATTSSGSGEYDGGDRVIGQGSYGVDGDLLMTAGWGDGAAVRRLNNDGSMTKLWHANQALYRDTTSTYNHINSGAIHPGSGTFIISTHNVNGYSTINLF